MPESIENILKKETFSHSDLVALLNSQGQEKTRLYTLAAEIKKQFVGNKVYFRGLVELSNICSKNCFYCGIRSGNTKPERYMVTEEEVLDAARFAFENGYGSLVLQSGERCDKKFVATVSDLLRKIKDLSQGKLGVTLSMGEQTEKTYREWFACGAHRYLIRIETSDRELFY